MFEYKRTSRLGMADPIAALAVMPGKAFPDFHCVQKWGDLVVKHGRTPPFLHNNYHILYQKEKKSNNILFYLEENDMIYGRGSGEAPFGPPSGH